MIPKSLLLLIIGLFVAWAFNMYVGIFGLSVVLTFYWTVYLRARKSSRKKIIKHKDIIISHFQNFNGTPGEVHFDYLYANSQHYLNFRSSTNFAITNYIVKAGLIITALCSVWKPDWVSLTACIVIGLATTILSSKYEKHFKRVVTSGRLNENKYAEFAATLNSYADFFKKRFPDSDHYNYRPNRKQLNNQ